LLGAWLRPADIDGAAGSLKKLMAVVKRLREEWPDVKIVVRGDSGSLPLLNRKRTGALKFAGCFCGETPRKPRGKPSPPMVPVQILGCGDRNRVRSKSVRRGRASRFRHPGVKTTSHSPW